MQYHCGRCVGTAPQEKSLAANGWDATILASLVPAQTQLFRDLTIALGAAAIVLAKETGGGAPFLDWEVGWLDFYLIVCVFILIDLREWWSAQMIRGLRSSRAPRALVGCAGYSYALVLQVSRGFMYHRLTDRGYSCRSPTLP
jgi:hypothetical protein